MDNKMMVPELRFEEFDNENIKLSNFSAFIESTLYGPRFNAKDYCPNGNVKTIRGTDVDSDGEFKYQQVPIAQIEQKTVDTHKLLDGDLVMITTAECGQTGVFRSQSIAYISSAYGVRIRLNNLGCPEYFKYFFQTLHAKKEIASYVRKATVANLPGSDILKIKTIVISVKEQQKIANFLTAIDQRITLLKQKKAALEQYKKGLMQKIFSQDIRFADDEGNDWKEIRFDELYEFKRTNSFSREKLNYENGEVFNIHYGDIHTKFKTHFDLSNEMVPFVDEQINLSKINEDEFIQTGDLVIADASEDYDDIGKAVEITQIQNHKIIAGLHTFLARRINDKLSVGFAGLMMQSEHVRLQIKKIAQGTKVLGISMGRLSKIKLKIPCPEEQQKIVNFLLAIDQQIGTLDKQISSSVSFKKGLLQRMFV